MNGTELKPRANNRQSGTEHLRQISLLPGQSRYREEERGGNAKMRSRDVVKEDSRQVRANTTLFIGRTGRTKRWNDRNAAVRKDLIHPYHHCTVEVVYLARRSRQFAIVVVPAEGEPHHSIDRRQDV